MAELSDIALVTQVAVFRNKRAFDQLVRKYQSPVRRFLLNLTQGNESLCDDLAQEAFIKAYTNIRKFRGLSSFKTWLFRIAYNVYYDYLRSEKRTLASATIDGGVPSDERLAAASSAPLSSFHAALRMDIHTALAQLKEEERTCITLQLIEGEPIDKIAEITGLPQNTVKSHLHRGKEKLTIYLKENGYD